MKKIKKVLAKNTAAVIVTVAFCIGAFNVLQDFIEQQSDSIKNQQQNLIRDKSVFEIKKKYIEDSLLQVAKSLKSTQQEHERVQIQLELKLIELQLREQRNNDELIFKSLLEKLRGEFGTIEPGVQITDNAEYMKAYRENEATNILAQVYAKKLGLYEQYQDFFKNRNGIWNIVMTQSK
jgi:hypothetical protein